MAKKPETIENLYEGELSMNKQLLENTTYLVMDGNSYFNRVPISGSISIVGYSDDNPLSSSASGISFGREFTGNPSNPSTLAQGIIGDSPITKKQRIYRGVEVKRLPNNSYKGRAIAMGNMANELNEEDRLDLMLAQGLAETTKFTLNDIMSQHSYESLAQKYQSQKEKFGHLLEGDFEMADTAFNKVATELYKLHPLKIKVSITESPSLFFSLNFRVGFKQFFLRYEVFFSSVNMNAAYSLYDGDDELILRNYGEPTKMIEEIESNTGFRASEYSSAPFNLTEETKSEKLSSYFAHPA